jgi:hypothetical protein
MVDRSTNRSRGFGFVTFENEESVDAVIKTENTILGKWVEVKRAEPRDMNRYDAVGGLRGTVPGFRGGRMGGMMDMRMGGGRYGMGGGRNPLDEYQSSYAGMTNPYGRAAYSGAYPAGYGPTPSPYGMQAGYGAGGYGAYPQGAYAGYGAGTQMPTGYSNPTAYGSRSADGEISSPTVNAGVGGSYGVSSPSMTGQTTTPATGSTASYDSYGRSQQQYQYPSTAMSGYGGAYGLYGATTPSAGAPRSMSAQEGYEGAYGAYRQGNAAQNRLDRGYKPY